MTAARTMTFVVDFASLAGILPSTACRMAASILSPRRLIDMAAAIAAHGRELLAGSPPFLAYVVISRCHSTFLTSLASGDACGAGCAPLQCVERNLSDLELGRV